MNLRWGAGGECGAESIDCAMRVEPSSTQGARGAECPALHAKAGEEAVEEARRSLGTALIATGAEDRRAFQEVYSRTSAKLFGICLRICGDRQGAEDVLHEVYLKVWKQAGAWDPSRGTAITWLATIARNRAIDWRRTQNVRRATSIDDAVANIIDLSPSVELAMVASERSCNLQHGLRALRPHQRDAIREAFFDGATYAELAAARDVPLGTVKSWVRRGLAQMKLQLDQMEGAAAP